MPVKALLNDRGRQASQVFIHRVLTLCRQLFCQGGQEVPQIADIFRHVLILRGHGDAQLLAHEVGAKPTGEFFVHIALVQHDYAPPI